jgi:hypothetical protein
MGSSIGDEAPLPWSKTDDVVARLCEPYRCASSRYDQLQALRELGCSLEQEANIATREEAALHVLLEIPTGDAQLADSVGRVLEACGSLASLLACVACLKQISEDWGTRKLTPTSGNQPFQSSQAPLRTCLSTLRGLLCAPGKNGRLTQGQARSIQPDWMEHFNLVGNTMLLLPQLIANACQAAQIHLPLWATSGRLLPRLVECELQTQDHMYSHVLIQYFVRHRNSDNVVMGVGRYLDNSRLEEDATEQDQFHDKLIFLTNVLVQASNILTPREVAVFIRSLLRRELSKEISMQTSSVESIGLSAILDLCQAMLQVSRNSQDAFLRLMAFQSSSVMADQSMDAQLCRIVLELLFKSQHEFTDSDDEDQDDEGLTNSPFHQHLQSMVDTWSQSIHVQQTDRRIQRHITTMLLYGLELMPSCTPQDEVHSMLTVGLLQGVTVRLESAITEVRIDGMRVAQLLAQRLGQDLEFDELKQEQAKVVDRMTNSGEALDESSPQLREKIEVMSKRTRIRKSKQKAKDKTEPQIMDPDADYVSDEEENDESSCDHSDDHEVEDDTAEVQDDDSIWDHEEDLVPYDLDDDEQDLRETPRPLHLRECLELLRTPETHDAAYSRHESALNELPALLKLRPDDLPDICVPLAVQLLRMENKFNIIGFAEKRSDSLCALLVQEPLSVGQRLIHELFEDGSLSDRMNVLLALQEAAGELSGNKILEEQRIGRFNSLEGQDSSNYDSSIGKTVSTHLEKLESQTRRKRSAHPQPLTISNKFSSIAPSWFYSLLGNFVQRRGDTAMWSGSIGSRLLAHFFFALTTIVESSGTTSAGTPVLAKDLFELVWSFRTVEVADVRKCVLVAVATTMALVTEDQIVAMLTDGDLSHVMAKIAQKDPDRDCRKLASSISLSVLQAMDSVHDRRIDFGAR